MLKVFFADAGDLDQLDGTLGAMAAEAEERLQRLAAMAGDSEDGAAFPERLHISALALRLQLDQELAVLTWTRWAREQVSRWRDTTDPGTWDHRAELRELVRLARQSVG